MPNIQIQFPDQVSQFPVFWILVSFAIFGTYLGGLLCVGQNILEKKTALNRLLSLLFVCLGLLQGTCLVYVFGLSSSFPRIVLLHIPVLGTIGPILYGIHKIIQNSEFEKSALGLSPKHSILPGIIWILYFISFVPDSHTIFEGIRTFSETRSVFDLFFMIPLLILAAYIAGLLRGSRILFKPNVLKEEWTARVLLYIILATIANHSVGAFFLIDKEPLFLLISASMMALSLCVSYLIGRRYPAYFQNLQEVARVTFQKYSRSLLQGMDIATLRENLLQSMEVEKLYKDEDLSLASLADELGLSSHQLSELINQEMGKNFSAFVNEYRIREACELLSKNKDSSILDIAYEVGFRSKTSFHRAFQKEVGVPPSEFREKNS
ncbi:helix-turn-helix domain-containing protein [Leptospira licerasiae]|uniref:DNA-binding helix-turn-helix protein n=1 Tax=Leptospira licerasiae str. MMD4847 TaxID=1049971 RepID=A0ABN0H3R7_9LEPT|nr:helix-turn-helix domain-containing protein [Leptospira licerasiae]EIE02191.1 DNA-binding helix-turn-helix protein [Leptospira licerasiae serovar Varillal str. VAR 010]EJZ40136.1 DNA-binding helix-turn-helix protein [Leptospira licerasiae str. MMD4847]